MDLAEIFIGLLMLVFGAGVIYIAWVILHWLYRIVFFSFGYDSAKTVEGKVTGMKYTPPRYHANGKSTTRTPEKNQVFFKTKLKTTEIDSDMLYQRVRIGDKIEVKYQRRFLKSRMWPGDWEFDGYRLISIKAPTDEVVGFNWIKPNQQELETLST